MISKEVDKIAAQCRHYAMCKIDYLETGLCPSGQRKQYVAYYPQGRMDLYHALAENRIPVSEGLVDIADTCTLCGMCDKQCHFVTGMRPMNVMRALKEHVDEHVKQGREVTAVHDDAALKGLKRIVGDAWATNDPAILVTYANDPFPLADAQMPRYVLLPGSRDEVAKIVKLANKQQIPYAVRGNGGSVFGFVFTDGIVMDMARMRSIDVDPDNWNARVGPGVTSFELQKAAYKHGFRVNVAEPAATVCGNIVCTGIFSTWTNAYGTCADNFIDAEFVGRDGKVFRLNEKTAPNVFAFQNEVVPSPGICTEAVVRLHPTTDDEEGVLVPFATFEEAVSLARELSMRRIGLAIGVLGGHYLSTFMSPSAALAEKVKACLVETLGIKYMVFVVGDRYARDAIKKMAKVVVDSRTFKALMLGLPRLLERNWQELVEGFESDKAPYELLCREEVYPLLEAVLAPSPGTIADAVDDDLKDFYEQLYDRPEMTNMVWLNVFRIVSSRMSRHKHMFAFLVYVPLDRIDIIKGVMAGFERIANAHGLDHDYGFLTPLDFGKRAIFEYDYYIDHTDEAEKEKVKRAMKEIEPWLDELSNTTKGVMSLKYVFSQGCSRKEHFLYL